MRGLLASLLLLAGLSPWPTQAGELGGELRLQRQWQSASSQGPLAQAHALLPAVPLAAANSSRAEAELRGRWQALNVNALLQQDQRDAGPRQTSSRFNEIYLAHDLGAWAGSLGKKIVSWDVGQAFRPNDVVQQEDRRTLFTTTLEGREVAQLEHYGSDTATSLVWVQPQRRGEATPTPSTANESAWAARHYRRLGALDLHGFARLGRHSGASLGAACAWVADDAWSLTASARWLQRHATTFNPQAGATAQLLLGASWTGEQQQSLLLEAWHDGSTPSDADWRTWQQRNATLVQPANPLALAAQASTLQPNRLRQDNLFLRLAWQPGAWTWSIDTLYMPADHGRILTLTGQWQGDRWKLYGALRRYAGPRSALVAQLPQNQAAVLALVWPF